MNFTPPNEEQRRAIFDEVKLAVDKVKAAELELIEWMSEQPHLPDHIDDNVLTAFAIYCKKGIYESKKRLDAYFSVRSMFPNLFEDRDPLSEDMVKTSSFVAHGMCDGYTLDYCRVYVVKLLNTDVGAFNFNTLIRRMLILHDLTLMRDLRSGIYLVADFAGVTVHHFLKLSISQARDFMFCIQNVYPLRVKKMIFINVKPFCKTLLETMIMPLLKRKIVNRTHFLSDTTKIEKLMPLEMLPCDMGGTGPSTEEINDFWNKEEVLFRDWILNEGSTKCDESKRKGTNNMKAPGCEVM